MRDITIIRHGQATVGATNEQNYDRLSPLGHQQAQWSGAYFAQVARHEIIVHGAMRRHKETAEGTNFAALNQVEDMRFNEMDYFGLADALRQDYGVDFPDDNADFPEFIHQLIVHWDELAKRHNLESQEAFFTRTRDALRDAQALGEHILVVSSGGVIASLAVTALNTPLEERWRWFAGIAHTSQHRFIQRGQGLELMQYGAVPHLDRPDRRDAITYV